MATITLIRHAPILFAPETGPVLAGRRTDLPADLADGAGLARLAAALPPAPRVLASPARRAQDTARALGLRPQTEPALWEQDFGDWDGRPAHAIPDLGPLGGDDLAAHRPPGGESFADLCARVWPCLNGLAGGPDAVIVAHAGVVRAALALALNSPAAGLRFRVDAPSVTQIASADGAEWAICRVNAAF